MKVIKQDQVITVLEREVVRLKEESIKNLRDNTRLVDDNTTLINEVVRLTEENMSLEERNCQISLEYSTLVRRNEQQENTLGILNGALKQATKEIELLKRKLRTINDISFDESTLLEYEDEEDEEEMDITLEVFLISIGIIE